MANTAPSAANPAKISNPSNSCAIDLVFLSSQTMGDYALELEVLTLFDQSAKKYQRLIENNENSNHLPIYLHSLKGAAAGVGAKSIVEIISLAQQKLEKTGSLKPEMISDILFAISSAREYIAQLTPVKIN